MPPPSILSALPSTGLHERATRSLEPAARRRVGARGVARIGHGAVGHQPVPDEQHEQRADGRADETRALVEPVPTDRLADEGCDERTGNPAPGRQYEAVRAIRTGLQSLGEHIATLNVDGHHRVQQVSQTAPASAGTEDACLSPDETDLPLSRSMPT